MKLELYPDGRKSFEISPDEVKQFLQTPLSKIKEMVGKKNIDKNKIGIVVAIATEDEEERKRVENDITKELNNFLNSQSLIGLFDIILLSQKEAEKIDNTNWQEILKSKKGSLIVFGRVYKRGGKVKNYAVKLEAGVIHNPIPVFLSKLISQEFSQLFPREQYFPVDDELLGFEVTADWIGLSVEYMVGIAFFVSSNLGPAFAILIDLNKKLKSFDNSQNITAIDQLKRKVPDRLVEVSLSICAFLYNTYSLKRDQRIIVDAKKYLDIISQYRPDEGKMKALEAIYYFLIEEDVDKAIAAFDKVDDPLKPYNLAFLYFFKDDVVQGLRYYKRALKRDLSGNVKNELEIFITETIDRYPDKYQLLFARAFINYKCRGDYKLAMEDFRKFIDKAYYEEKKYEELLRRSVIYNQELSRKI